MAEVIGVGGHPSHQDLVLSNAVNKKSSYCTCFESENALQGSSLACNPASAWDFDMDCLRLVGGLPTA